jgi:aspartate-semialdehyde dehydrogenase
MIHLIDQNFGLEKCIAFVLQPVSAFDVSGIDELAHQSAELLAGNSFSKTLFNEQIAFNLLSHIEATDANGFTPVEKQIRSEITKIFENDQLPLSLTLVQAPIFHTYSIMTFVEILKKTEIDNIRSIFNNSSYFFCDSPSDLRPVSSVSAAGKNEIQIGEIKKDPVFPMSYWIWAIADNLTLGSALNGYEIACILNSIADEDK